MRADSPWPSDRNSSAIRWRSRDHPGEDVFLYLGDVVDPLELQVEQLDPEVGDAAGRCLQDLTRDLLAPGDDSA